MHIPEPLKAYEGGNLKYHHLYILLLVGLDLYSQLLSLLPEQGDLPRSNHQWMEEAKMAGCLCSL
jgi:hypothetical protein